MRKPIFVPYHCTWEPFAQSIRYDLMESDLQEEAMDFYKQNASMLTPSFSFREAVVENIWVTEDGVPSATIGSVTFHGRALSLLEKGSHVYPYSVTCGWGLEKLVLSEDDFLPSFWKETMKRDALSTALSQGLAQCKKEAGMAKLLSINPGSGQDGRWDVGDLNQLFDLLHEEVETEAYVTKSSCMLPNKSIAGIWFSSSKNYSNCSTCPRKDCNERMAPYEEKSSETHILDE